MRPLESCRADYFYDDWEAVCSSAGRAEEMLSSTSRAQEVDRARRRWALLMHQGALFKRSHGINWRVVPDPLSTPHGLLEKLSSLGSLIDRFLRGIDRGLGSSAFLQGQLGFPICPEEGDLWEIERGTPLLFFRLDLTLDEHERPMLLEIQVVAGGLGIAQALRAAYGPHPELSGTAAPYEAAVLAAFQASRRARGLSFPDRPLGAVLGTRNSAYRHDHLVLARHLKGMNMVVAPLIDLTEDSRSNPQLPDGRRPSIIHRLFRSPHIFKRSPRRARLLLESLRRGEIFMANPWKDVLEDKRLLALVHHSRTPGELLGSLSPEEWSCLRSWVPQTRTADSEAVADLIDRSRSQRAFYLKKGRSFESRQVWDGQQVNLRQWNAVLEQAKRDGDWIIQEAVRGRPWSLRYLDFQSQKIRDMQGFVRLSPYYFRTADGAVSLGEVLVTAREERSRVHGASDALLAVFG